MLATPLKADSINAICEHIAARNYDDLPANAIEAVKACITDTIAATLAGREATAIREFVGVLASWGGGSPESSVMLDGIRLPASEAVLANVAMASALRLGNFHAPTGTQPIASTLWPAAAFAEARGGISGKQFLAAIVLGSDLIARMALAAPHACALGYHPALFSGFGAAAVVGKLKGFDAKLLRNAIGIMLSQASATLQAAHDGVEVCDLQFGFNASDGFRSAEMAEVGIIGVRQVIDGEFGFARMFSRGQADHSALLGRLGAHYYTAELTRVSEQTLTLKIIDSLAGTIARIEDMSDVGRLFGTLEATAAREYQN